VNPRASLDATRIRSSISDKGKILLCSPQLPDRPLFPASLISNGYLWLFSQGINLPGREADDSPASSTEVKVT
jgi:hypothetical protein